MPELTPEERQRIYEEERVRAEARQHYENQAAPAPPPQDNSILTGCCVLVVLFVVAAGLVGSCNHGSTPAPPSGPSTFDASVMAHEFVLKRLKAPSTADFSSTTDETIEELSSAPPTFRVKGWVDSQNGFGAKLRSNFWVKLHTADNGGKWTADDVEILSN